ncbi:MAG: cytochrome c class [Deltaproteobacteria bacterium]|nr:cytochrome c class [Deltaproteobacteria bacterium]
MAVALVTFFSLFMGDGNTTLSDQTKIKPTQEVPLLLSIANKFTGAERFPVKFFHDRHVIALPQEGCQTCHDPDKKGNNSYAFPRIKNEKNKKSLMNSYHKACIGCHKEIAQYGKSSGPVTCGKCHVVTTRIRKQTPWPGAEFDFYLHKLHSEVSQGNCVSCHHTGDRSSCRDCHGLSDNGIPSYKNAAHSTCLKCHLDSGAGPYSCGGCHSEIKRSLKELAETPRPNIGQPEKTLINLEGAEMTGVTFNHKNHEGYTTSCKVCHHKTMKNCNTCHTLKENQEGGNISLAFAYHNNPSERSCLGCHESRKLDSQCIGCHQAKKIDFTETFCLACHRLHKDETLCPQINGNPANLFPQKLPVVLEINPLENKYLPVQFPHTNHIKHLTDISQKNKLSNYFHCNQMTVCMGCHHHSALYPARPVPSCNTCHPITTQKQKAFTFLQGAYHRRCIACHKGMKIGPTSCNNGCHLPKKSGAAGGISQ